jgi:molybdopterin-binding protein
MFARREFPRQLRLEGQRLPQLSCEHEHPKPGTIEEIISDKVVSELLIRTAAGNVTSIITTGSVRRMNLKEGDSVFARIKATEVSIDNESSAGN